MQRVLAAYAGQLSTRRPTAIASPQFGPKSDRCKSIRLLRDAAANRPGANLSKRPRSLVGRRDRRAVRPRSGLGSAAACRRSLKQSLAVLRLPILPVLPVAARPAFNLFPIYENDLRRQDANQVRPFHDLVTLATPM